MTKVYKRIYCMMVLLMTTTLLIRGPAKLFVKQSFPEAKWNHIVFDFEPVQPSFVFMYVHNRRKTSERRRQNRRQRALLGNRNQEMKIVAWNTGNSHLKNQMEEVLWLTEEQRPHIMFLSESNLWRNHEKDLVKIDGYEIHTTKMIRNPDRQVSRLVAYVKEGIIARRRDDLEVEDMSAIWMEVGLPHKKKFLLCGVYREWAHLKLHGETGNDQGSKNEQEARWNEFLDVWEDSLDEETDVTVIGDANLDLNKVFSDRRHFCRNMAEELKMRILSRGVTQLVTENTRFVSSCEPSRLDHIYMTKPELGTYKVLPWGTSDHRVVILNKKVKGSLPQAMRLRKRVFKNFSRRNFIDDIKNITWWPTVYSEENLEKAAKAWEKAFRQVLDKHCPVKSINLKKNYTPWLTSELKDLSTSLSTERSVLDANWNKESQKKLDLKANELKEKLRKAEEEWRKKESRKMIKDEAKTWINVKKWLGWRSTSQPEQLRDSERGNLSVGALRNCNIMNNFYLEKVRKIKQDMPETEGDPCLELGHMIKFNVNEENEFKLSSVSPEKVLETAKKMKKSVSMGRDDIPADLFLIALPHMLSAVTHLINLSIRDAKFPDLWKTSKICPLFKGGNGDKNDPKQYRPVALLPICARLLEKIVCNQVMDHLYEHDMLHSHNHGYRKSHGTITAVLEAQEEAMEAMEAGEILGMVTLDQSSAFDVIEHQILKSKLMSYGFGDNALKWFTSYLHGRSQYVSLQSSNSDIQLVGPYACPQGSCLGPLIWNIYCGEVCEVLSVKGKLSADVVTVSNSKNEILNGRRVGNLFQYADDLMVLIRGKTVEQVRSLASYAYTILANWFLRNRLKLNSDKTHFMYIMTSQRAVGKDVSSPLLLEADSITPGFTEKVLGITLETTMSMRSHLIAAENSMIDQVAKKMRGLWLMKRHLTFKSRKMTAWGLVMSKLLYGIEVWGPAATERQIKHIQTVQNSIMRFICDEKRGVRTKDLLSMTGMLSVRQLIVYRVLMTGLAAVFTQKPDKIGSWGDVLTRRLKTTQRSFRFMFGELRHKLPPHLKEGDPKLKKSMIKEWVSKNIPTDRKWNFSIEEEDNTSREISDDIESDEED